MAQHTLATDTSVGFDLELPLHPATDNAEDVALLLHRVLGIVDEFCADGDTTNADAVQALTLATALRLAIDEASERADGMASPKLLDIAVADAPPRLA
jgi:hypothetical protein